MPGGRSEATGELPQDRQDNVRVRNMLINKKSPHGGDIYTNQVRLDFSANTNPAGTPEAVREAVRSSADNCAAYPDPYCTELRKRIAAAEGVPENGRFMYKFCTGMEYFLAFLPAVIFTGILVSCSVHFGHNSEGSTSAFSRAHV